MSTGSKRPSTEDETHRLPHEYAAAKRRLAQWEHFDKVQTQVKLALDLVGNGTDDGTYAMHVECEDEALRDQLLKAHRAYQDHADALNEDHSTITVIALSKHIENSRRFLTILGKATGNRAQWQPKEEQLLFGHLKLDFSKPLPTEVGVHTHGRFAIEQCERPVPLIAPVGIFHPMFPVVAILVLLVAACVSLLR